MENTTDGEFRASPSRAIQSFLDPEEWVENLLWLSVCAFSCIFIVGYIPIFGYGAELIERRSGRPDFPRTRIESERLGDYFGKGIWPFAIAAAIYMVVGPVLALLHIPFFFMLEFLDEGPEVLILLLLMIPVSLIISGLVTMLGATVLIRAMIVQDFAKAFDIAWCRHFLSVMWKEMVVSGIKLWFMTLGLYLLGMLLCCIGYIPAIGLAMGAGVHLCAQWYEIYLSRGGIPVPSKEASIVDATIVN